MTKPPAMITATVRTRLAAGMSSSLVMLSRSTSLSSIILLAILAKMVVACSSTRWSTTASPLSTSLAERSLWRVSRSSSVLELPGPFSHLLCSHSNLTEPSPLRQSTITFLRHSSFLPLVMQPLKLNRTFTSSPEHHHLPQALLTRPICDSRNKLVLTLCEDVGEANPVSAEPIVSDEVSHSIPVFALFLVNNTTHRRFLVFELSSGQSASKTFWEDSLGSWRNWCCSITERMVLVGRSVIASRATGSWLSSWKRSKVSCFTSTWNLSTVFFVPAAVT